jgi:hypothetical protein
LLTRLPTQGYIINVYGIPINMLYDGMGDCALAWNTKVKAQCATVTRITIASEMAEMAEKTSTTGASVETPVYEGPLSSTVEEHS